MGNAAGRRKALRAYGKAPITKEHTMSVEANDKRDFSGAPIVAPDDSMRSYPTGYDEPRLLQSGRMSFLDSLDSIVCDGSRSPIRLRTRPDRRCKVCNLAGPVLPSDKELAEWKRAHEPLCKDWAARRDMLRRGWLPVDYLACWSSKAEPATYFRNSLLSFQLDSDQKGRTIFTETSDSLTQGMIWVRVWALQVAWEVWRGAYNGGVPNQTARTIAEAAKCVRATLEAYSAGLGNEDPPEEMRRLEAIYTLLKRSSPANASFWNEEWFRAWQDLPGGDFSQAPEGGI